MVEKLFDLNGRVALVTGAASGIGREAARVLAGLGATVYASDRDLDGVETLVATLPNGASAWQHDVTLPERWNEVVEAIKVRAGRLDVLVNNAGIMIKRSFLENSFDDFRMVQRVNVDSVFLGMHTCLPLMIETASCHATSPSIINVASIYGQVAGAAFSAYSASKGAVRMMTKAVAAEYAKTGVRVNSVNPGPVMTNLSAKFDPQRDQAGNPVTPEQARAAIERVIPMGRMGSANEIAGAIAFLASDASCFMTGTDMVADGGYTAV
ncbi:MAG: SDR family oxidoreductase [Azoarcus sp.]|jgi:NAD(P)-dependent dehydrogenase (short-subunit alcohol dehydrogenase family)|nr:SDR family oxidoreductase [Azoarcus sp.]